MIVDIEKLKQHRTILSAHRYRLGDGLSEEACEFAVNMFDEIIANLELCGIAMLRVPEAGLEPLKEKGGKTCHTTEQQ